MKERDRHTERDRGRKRERDFVEEEELTTSRKTEDKLHSPPLPI